MATKNICTYPMQPALAKNANAIIEQEGKLRRVNLDWEFDKKANAIVSEADGEVISVSDSSMARPKNLIICGKNTQESTNGYQLFNAGNCEGVGSNASINVSDDEYIITATGGVSAGYGFSKFPLDISKCVGKTLFMKVDDFTGGTGSGVMLYGFKGGANAVSYTLKPGDKSIECPIAEDIEEVKLYIYTNTTGNVFAELNAITVKGLMVSYDKDAEWEKYTGGKPAPNTDYPQEIVSVENISILFNGKNLLNVREMLNEQLTENSDGSFKLIRTENGRFSERIPVQIPANTPFTISYKITEHNAVEYSSMPAFMQLYFADGTYYTVRLYSDGRGETFNRGKEVISARLYINNEEAVGTYAILEYIQIELGETKSEYEQYKEPQTILLTNTLSGIEVTGTTMDSLANYTDAEKRKWICDEVDLERGVYVQRVKCLTLDENTQIWIGTHANGQPYISVYPGDNALTSIMRSNRYRPAPFNWSNENGYIYCINTAIIILDSRFSTAEAAKEVLKTEKPEILYVLAEPIETPLSDAEIYAFKNTEMNYPNTTILNDAGAFMKLDYFADTLKYVLKHGGGGGFSTVSKFTMNLPASEWKTASDNTYYYQEVTVPGATVDSKIDLQPSPAQLISLLNNGTSMFAANEDGTITVYVIGSKPTTDMTIQATKMEVVYV